MFGLFPNLNITATLIAVNLILLLVTGGGFFFYWNYSQSQIHNLESSVATAQAAISAQQASISRMENLSLSQKASVEQLQTGLARSETARSQLAQKISNLNITQGAQTNLPLLQSQINSDLNSLFEGIAGGTSGKVKK